MTKMPEVNILIAESKIVIKYTDTDEGLKILRKVVKKDGTIRATRPVINRNDPVSGKAAYVWRMVCFMVSPRKPHQCMPVSAFTYLPSYDKTGKWTYSLCMKMADSLKTIEDAIIDGVKKTNWHGVKRWANLI